MMNEKEEIIEIAKRILKQDICLIEASRKLVSLQYKNELQNDEDLKIFWVIESETDHFPNKSQFNNYSSENQLRLKQEMTEVEKFYEEAVKKSCLNLINKFEII